MIAKLAYYRKKHTQNKRNTMNLPHRLAKKSKTNRIKNKLIKKNN